MRVATKVREDVVRLILFRHFAVKKTIKLPLRGSLVEGSLVYIFSDVLIRTQYESVKRKKKDVFRSEISHITLANKHA